jgi:hypothetical protein
MPKKKWKRGHSITPEELEKRALDIDAAIEAGALSYTKISKVTGYTLTNINTVFKKKPELHKKYKVALMSVQLQAVSNMVDIIMDQDHPKNFEATKSFLGKYKTELDEVFEQGDPTSFELNTPNGCPIQINFTPQNVRKEE